MKSEVKKKMTFNEHATDTPKSLNRSSSRNFFAGIPFRRLPARLFCEKSERYFVYNYFHRRLFKKTNRHAGGCMA
jgi:hypothetical protein